MSKQSERLKDLRFALKLNQSQLGKKLGIKGQSISSAEKGLSNLSNDNLAKLIVEFNVNINWLLTGRGDMFTDDETQEQKIESQVKKVLDKYGLTDIVQE
jgi:transcriptional regulator with XRE-family HTH domain